MSVAYTAEWRRNCGRWAKFRGANLHLQKQAHAAFRKALNAGLLERKPCVICGNARSEGHHEDYAAPLDVIWLCSGHHKWRHTGDTFEEMHAYMEAS